SCVRTSPHCQSADRPPALGFEPIASNLKMSVKLEVEFREKQNAHVLRRSIVTAWPYPRGMRRHLVSPCDDVGKLVPQILGRRKSLLENLNEIMQCARVPEEAIADHRIARLSGFAQCRVRHDPREFVSSIFRSELASSRRCTR